ncbi:endolytic transglycosylase MltG [Bacillus sp. T33-2]|uniref:endolytic transglycosylase MltG n=1 Tax=Bacillus sp. T33-2 TaxID=2054168 RepID=UPI000C79189E|nr:endolytic transglycosylase MltG [Bacillus sp. T33-2]PLR93767.1 endolytic transglycosylase MltG [Bacillus sp. T33-2]
MSEGKNTETNKPGSSEKKQQIYEKLIEKQSEAKVVRKIVFITAIVLFVLIGAIAGGGYFYVNSALKPVDPGSKKVKTVEIPIGSSVSGIAQILEDNGIIRDARIFKYYVKFKNDSGFMAGEYKMKPSMTIPEIITSLKTGRVMQDVALTITIPEGKQLSQIAGIIAEKSGRNHEEVLSELNDREFVNSLIEKYPDVLSADIINEKIKHPLEGYLFPATYSFYTKDPSVEKIVTDMLNKTKSVLEEYRGQMEELNLSVHHVMTMASLIEEEATEKAERDKISSVFHNRIEQGMPLQTDPTILYAQGKHKDRVVYKDLEVDSPYNTYKYAGLPPGPIANPGTMSIEAALSPEKTDLLYFLADSSGEVHFSRTLEEHNQLKAKYITSQK